MQKPLIILVTTATAGMKTAEENLGLAYLSAVCRKNGFEIIVIDGWMEWITSEKIIERIMAERKPLFVGFSCNQLNGDSAIEIVKTLKLKKYIVPFVAGGFAPTFNPNKFLDSGFDFVSMAEGEETIMDLCTYFLNGKPEINQIRGQCYYDAHHNLCLNKPAFTLDLDELPFPCRDTMDFAIKYKTPINLVTSRGCMANCLFCSVSAFGRLGEILKWRGRSANNIVDELEQLYYKGIRHFKFVDDSFLEPPRDEEWCNNFANEIQNRGLKDIRLRLTVRADRITDGIVSALDRAGCNLYTCGIENYSDTALKRMGKRSNSEQNTKALDIFKKTMFTCKLVIFCLIMAQHFLS